MQLKTARQWIAGLSFMMAPMFLRRQINSAGMLVVLNRSRPGAVPGILWRFARLLHSTDRDDLLREDQSRHQLCGVSGCVAGLLTAKRRDLDADVFRLLLPR